MDRGGFYTSKWTISEARTSRPFVVPLTRISVNFQSPAPCTPSAHQARWVFINTPHFYKDSTFPKLVRGCCPPYLCGLRRGAAQLLHVACLKWRQPTEKGGDSSCVGVGGSSGRHFQSLGWPRGRGRGQPIKLGLPPPNLSGRRRRIIYGNVWHLSARFTSKPACAVGHNVLLLFMFAPKQQQQQQHCFDANDGHAWPARGWALWRVCPVSFKLLWGWSWASVGRPGSCLSEALKSIPKIPFAYSQAALLPHIYTKYDGVRACVRARVSVRDFRD